MQVFVFLVNRWQCIYNSFYTPENLIGFMLYDHHILTFQNNLKYSDISYASCFFLQVDDKMPINALKSLISKTGLQYLSLEFLARSLSAFLNERANNLLVFVNLGSIVVFWLYCYLR